MGKCLIVQKKQTNFYNNVFSEDVSIQINKRQLNKPIVLLQTRQKENYSIFLKKYVTNNNMQDNFQIGDVQKLGIFLRSFDKPKRIYFFYFGNFIQNNFKLTEQINVSFQQFWKSVEPTAQTFLFCAINCNQFIEWSKSKFIFDKLHILSLEKAKLEEAKLFFTKKFNKFNGANISLKYLAQFQGNQHPNFIFDEAIQQKFQAKYELKDKTRQFYFVNQAKQKQGPSIIIDEDKNLRIQQNFQKGLLHGEWRSNVCKRMYINGFRSSTSP